MRRTSVALLAAFLIALAAVPTAGAAGDTVTRTWTTRLGTDGSNGSAALRAYRAGIGTLTVSLKSLRQDTSYAVQIRAGTCNALGSVLASPASIRTDAGGRADTVRPLTITQMNDVWRYGRARTIALRLVAGSSIRCGNLTFPRVTRVVLSGYRIDLPVIPGPAGYPPCGVAMYIRELWQPREPGVSVVYAHARRGMFLPLLTASKVNDGAAMIGDRFRVYTSDSRVHTYRIIAVRRHVRSIQNAAGSTTERLWLYTSEGPNFRYPKLVIVAQRISTARATYGASHPRARPRAC
jgi:hypothetical protein